MLRWVLQCSVISQNGHFYSSVCNLSTFEREIGKGQQKEYMEWVQFKIMPLTIFLAPDRRTRHLCLWFLFCGFERKQSMAQCDSLRSQKKTSDENGWPMESQGETAEHLRSSRLGQTPVVSCTWSNLTEDRQHEISSFTEAPSISKPGSTAFSRNGG